MIVTDTITEEDRRDTIRELSDVTSKSYDDTKLDRKIKIGDTEAQAWLQTTEASDIVVIVSNYVTARNIRLGIGDTDNQNAARDLMSQAKDLVKAHNDKADVQNDPYIVYSQGINSESTGTFS